MKHLKAIVFASLVSFFFHLSENHSKMLQVWNVAANYARSEKTNVLFSNVQKDLSVVLSLSHSILFCKQALLVFCFSLYHDLM